MIRLYKQLLPPHEGPLLLVEVKRNWVTLGDPRMLVYIPVRQCERARVGIGLINDAGRERRVIHRTCASVLETRTFASKEM